jgi:hypothetical protein
MALHGPYQASHESTEKAKHNRKFPPSAEVIAALEEHEIDLMPDADEDLIGHDEFLDEKITGIEEYQASGAVHEVAIEDKHAIPELEEHSDGHNDPEHLSSLQRDLDGLWELGRGSRAHKYRMAMDSAGEHKSTPVTKRSLSAERLDVPSAFHVEPVQVKITLCIGGTRVNEIFVSERASMDDLRKIVSNHFQGRCRVHPDEFPLRDET